MVSDTREVPFNYLSGRQSFKKIRDHTHNLFLSQAHRVDTGSWQGINTKKRPDLVSYELMNYTFTHELCGIEDLGYWRKDIEPNLPWADDHFKERICGSPINPGKEWENWPWNKSASNFVDPVTGQFNQNYMERYWNKFAGVIKSPTYHSADWEQLSAHRVNRGIRNEYGDLDDLVQSLAFNPHSRQEWFPIFHPEDVGIVTGKRKPCSLGYQFWVRSDKLHVYYPLRSCDFIRHMQDDIYLTLRLLLWVLDECRKFDEFWQSVEPGTFTMHCTSLHVFVNDFIDMKKKGPM